jgi:hypothetical protein
MLKMINLNIIDKCRTLLICVASFCLISSTASGIYVNEEFGIRVPFPNGFVVCPASSGGHLHGFGGYLSSRSIDCQGAESKPHVFLGIYGEGNTTFRLHPSDLLPCHATGLPEYIGVDLRGLSIAGRSSASCAVRNSDGSIVIYVVAQGGHWGQGDNAPRYRAPLMNYIASLGTNPNRVGRDLVIFREFLSRIEIRDITTHDL